VPISDFYIQQHYGKSFPSLPHQILTERRHAAAGLSIGGSRDGIEMPVYPIAARIVVAFAGPFQKFALIER